MGLTRLGHGKEVCPKGGGTIDEGAAKGGKPEAAKKE
jgi:hypothetical protein